jgi:hypothetical protein
MALATPSRLIVVVSIVSAGPEAVAKCFAMAAKVIQPAADLARDREITVESQSGRRRRALI